MGFKKRRGGYNGNGERNRMRRVGDSDFEIWSKFYSADRKSNVEFAWLLKNIDKFFLTSSPPKEFADEEGYDDGLMEGDFRASAFSRGSLDAMEEKARLSMALMSGADLSPWKEKYEPEVFEEGIAKSLAFGDYERYGFEFSNGLKTAVERGYLNKSSIGELSLLRGMELGRRYPEEADEMALKAEIRKNSIKIKTGRIRFLVNASLGAILGRKRSEG